MRATGPVRYPMVWRDWRGAGARPTFPAMIAPERERRTLEDRRTGEDRRVRDASVPVERRTGSDRRSGAERRLALQSAAEQVHAALGLLTRAVEAGSMADDQRRLLDAAMLRLRFAIDRLGSSED